VVRHSIAGEQNRWQGTSLYQTLRRGDDLFLIAGPCAIEAEKHALMMAHQLSCIAPDALCFMFLRPLTTRPAVAAH
jgi:3-deoxy-D-arabino-heptulosonate 7-phosphate (DAHP) synthase